MNDAVSLLSGILSFFEEAECRAAEARQRWLSLCDRSIRITYTSRTLEDLLFRALAHLEASEDVRKPAFRIFACDRNALGRDVPGWVSLEWLSLSGARTVAYNDRDFHLLYNPSGPVLSVVDGTSRRGWYYVPLASGLPFYEKAAPMRMILHWFCESYGCTLVHAAAIGWRSRAVILAGRGGSGKSTTALLAA